MSQAIVESVRNAIGDAIVESSAFRGDEELLLRSERWLPVARVCKESLRLRHFIDLTAVDYPERVPELPRFDVVLLLRSPETGQRIRLKTRVAEGQELESVVPCWAGANWAEREVFDMFGIRFRGHPDLRRILMYEEFEGYPLRKDYPIEQTQPLVPYRDVEGVHKLPPFGLEEGQPWGRIQWQNRLHGRDRQTSPAIALQTGQRRMLSDTDAYNYLRQKIAPTSGAQESAPNTTSHSGTKE